MESTDEHMQYRVVINDEEQYSIWPADRENALGWSDAGKIGTKQECLDYIESVWIDMRPLSLRKAMEMGEGVNKAVEKIGDTPMDPQA